MWAVVAAGRFVDPLFLPGPLAVAQGLYAGFVSGNLAIDAVVTTFRSLVGFALAALLGVPLGLLVGRMKPLSRGTQPTIDFFRSVPATALFPLFSFAFGIGDKAKIAIVIYACSLITLVNTAYGAMQVKELRIQSARILGASTWSVFWKVVLPESAPGILAGLRIGMSLAFVLIVVTEMFIGTTVGLGYRIVTSQNAYNSPDVYAAIALTGVLGYCANWVILRIEKRYLHWVGK